jgi:hypothetical protein
MKGLFKILFFRYDVNNVDTVPTTVFSVILWLLILLIIIGLKLN